MSCIDESQMPNDVLSDNQSSGNKNSNEPKFGGSYKHVDETKHSRGQRTSYPHSKGVSHTSSILLLLVISSAHVYISLSTSSVYQHR